MGYRAQQSSKSGRNGHPGRSAVPGNRRDNLTFFDSSITDEELHEVLNRLELDQWLESLPDGLDTMLESGSGGLSAGQAQLLAFTRVFLRDPGSSSSTRLHLALILQPKPCLSVPSIISSTTEPPS